MPDLTKIAIGAAIGAAGMWFAKPFIDSLLFGAGELPPYVPGPRIIAQTEEMLRKRKELEIQQSMWKEAIAYNPRAYSGTASYNQFYGL